MDTMMDSIEGQGGRLLSPSIYSSELVSWTFGEMATCPLLEAPLTENVE
jgi:hypothetical protein